MADHLGWFDKRGETIEDIMREKGMTVGRGVVDFSGSGSGNGSSDEGSGSGVGVTGGGVLDEGSGSMGELSETAASAGLAVHEHEGVVEILPSTVEERGSTTAQSDTPPGTT